MMSKCIVAMMKINENKVHAVSHKFKREVLYGSYL